MSDDERDIDIESDDADDYLDDGNGPRQGSNGTNHVQGQQAEKRAHHNALERKRRDHIKDSFTSLRDSVPSLNGEKASRAQILKKAADYITQMRKQAKNHASDIDTLKKQNAKLLHEIDALEKAKTTGNFAAAAAAATRQANKTDSASAYSMRESESEMSDSESSSSSRTSKRKRMDGADS